MFGLKDEVIRSVIEKIEKYYEIDKAILFGSRARGDYKKTSDIDIAVFGEQINSKILNLLRNDMDDLDIIYKVDVVYFDSLNKEVFKENIIKDGTEIYNKSR